MTSFEHFMEDCMTRDWAANKRQLFGLIAPYSGAADAAASSRWPSAAGVLSRLKRVVLGAQVPTNRPLRNNQLMFWQAQPQAAV